MGAFPRGAEAECGACRRGFNSTAAFDRHRQGFRCLEPSSIGMWLATDGLWSNEPRDPQAEHERNDARMAQARDARIRARCRAESDEQADRMSREGVA